MPSFQQPPASDAPDAANRATQPRTTLLLSRRQVSELLGLDGCIAAVESALREHAAGRSIPPAVLGVHVEGGGFHVKAAGLGGATPYFAAKLNGNFYANTERFGLPRIQGLILLCDARNGYPLAVMDSIEITALRTAAASAVAAKYLARSDAAVATICGCGIQGRAHLDALRRGRSIRMVYAFDRDPEAAQRLASWATADLGIKATATRDLVWAAQRSDLIVTTTPSHQPLLGRGDVAKGAFIAAVGADSESKQELHPELLAAATVVVDHLEQCAAIGDLHHALEQGLVARADVHAELHEVVASDRPGRTSDDEITIFDSTGIALEDVAASALVYERARQAGIGTPLELI